MECFEYFVGIDPSMNSTGICVQKYQDGQKIKENFIILTHDRRLTKRENLAENAIFEFEYWFYKYEDLKPHKEKDDNHTVEWWKTYNMISCSNEICHIVKEFTKDKPSVVYIVIEGISYGSSIRTKSIFDLAGLNYLIRNKFLNKEGFILTIVPPSEIKKFASGNGNCKKEIMIGLFEDSHTEMKTIPKIDDIADAWFMANYASQIKKEIF